MTIKVECSSCGREMSLQADESAGQEIIDRLSRVILCDACVGPTPKKRNPYKNPGYGARGQNAEYLAPYAD